MELVFFETPLFTWLLPKYLDDQNYRELQLALLHNPQMGDLMPGRISKSKVAGCHRRGKGKRGGLRVIYYYLIADNQIWFFTIYDKSEVIDLSSDEKKQLKQAIQRELVARRIK